MTHMYIYEYVLAPTLSMALFFLLYSGKYITKYTGCICPCSNLECDRSGVSAFEHPFERREATMMWWTGSMLLRHTNQFARTGTVAQLYDSSKVITAFPVNSICLMKEMQ